MNEERFLDEPRLLDEDAATPPYSPESAARPTLVQGVVERHRDELLKIDGVVGVAVGRTPVGDDAVIVYVDRPTLEDRVPDEVKGYPVQIEVVPGGFEALEGR